MSPWFGYLIGISLGVFTILGLVFFVLPLVWNFYMIPYREVKNYKLGKNWDNAALIMLLLTFPTIGISYMILVLMAEIFAPRAASKKYGVHYPTVLDFF